MVDSDERQLFNARLSDEKPVEWVPVQRFERLHGGGVNSSNGELLDIV